MTAMKNATILMSLTCLCASAAVSASAQTVERVYRTEQTTTRVNTIPRVIERRVISEPLATINTEFTTPQRSNYSKRLGDMLEQLSMAHDRGWLTDQQFSDLRNRESSVAMEELILRQRDGGIVTRADADRLERHLNSLAYTINQAVDEGSRVANSGLGPF